MNTDKILEQARKMALKAKPGYMKYQGKLYTFVFDLNTWAYKVYEDGFFMLSYNTKSLATAKRWLKHHLEN